jgi:hypothetical protein
VGWRYGEIKSARVEVFQVADIFILKLGTFRAICFHERAENTCLRHYLSYNTWIIPGFISV